jgi:hypothetical protein
LAMIAKKCHSIKDFFMTKIPPTLVESRYPTPNQSQLRRVAQPSSLGAI